MLPTLHLLYTLLVGGSLVVQPYVGYSESELNWSIPGQNVNVLSELEYENIAGIGKGITFHYSAPVDQENLWSVTAQVDIGSTSFQSGSYRDSDYLGYDRTNLFSRSTGDVDGERASRQELGIGLLRSLGDSHGLQLSFGRFDKKINIDFINGFQEISAPPLFMSVGRIGGLDSSYNTGWQGFWGAASWEFNHQHLRLAFELRGYQGDYKGVGHWNLREDLEQPVSFIHTAQSSGARFSITGKWQLGSNWATQASLVTELQETDSGSNRIYFSSGRTVDVGFNEASWKTSALNLGIAYTF